MEGVGKMTRLIAVDADGTLAAMVAMALELGRSEIEARLVEIQTELDDIGPTFGMQWRRNELNREKNELLDQLIGLRCAGS
jgi:hypothetical protein